MPRKDYDDLMGLDMYDEFVTPDMIQDGLIAAGAATGAILLASWVTPYLPAPEEMSAENQHRLRAGIAAVGGLLVGRGLWDYNREAALAVIGGVTGLAAAQFIDSFFDIKLLGGTPLGLLPTDTELSQGDEALLANYDADAQAALASLETTNVSTAPGAFAGPVVTPEQLFGLGEPVVQQEVLGDYGPWLS